MKVNLGKEILEIIRGIMEDEKMEQMTDLRFQPHVTLFSQSNLSPERRASLFKTASSVLVSAVSIGAMSLREKKMNDKEPLCVRVLSYQF